MGEMEVLEEVQDIMDIVLPVLAVALFQVKDMLEDQHHYYLGQVLPGVEVLLE